jgi:hypothetical protein
MPTDDPRLEQALHDAAPAVTTAGVVAEVSHRRVRRRRNRRLGATALAGVGLLVVSTVTVLVTRDDNSSPHVASPGAGLHARVITTEGAVDDSAGTTLPPTEVVLDQDPQLLSEPVYVGATTLSTASYDRGPDGDVLSHVVRVDGTHVVDMANFKARILSIAEGEGARWAITQNPRVSPGGTIPDTFLKRIPAVGDPTSQILPLNADPVGPVVAVGGAVWIPVHDGVLQYDVSGNYVRAISLPDAAHRWVAQVGKFAYATDGKRLHSLEVTGESNDTITYPTDVVGLAAAGVDGRVLLAAPGGGGEKARVARATTGGGVDVIATLPDGFVPDGLAASTTRVWATGTVEGAPAIVLLGNAGVRATVVLEDASDGAALAWTDAHTVRAVNDGKLFEIHVP